MVQASTFKLLALALALQAGTLAAQTPASPDMPTPAQPTPPAAQQMPIDPATGRPIPTRAEVAARIPPAIRAITAEETVEYNAWLGVAFSRAPDVNPEERIAALNKVLELDEATFGPDHPETLGTLTLLAEVLRTQARYAEAEPVAQRALQVSKAVLGERHPGTLTRLNNYA